MVASLTMRLPCMSDLTVHPEFQRLLDDVESLRGEVAAKLAEIHDLQHVVKPNLLALYQSKLGPWELKLLSAQCDVARVKRKIALAQASLNREQPVDWKRIDEQLEVEFLAWKARIDETAAKVQEAQEHFKHALSVEDSAELKKLYYSLVKALHPDLHPDQTEKDQQLWQQVQNAYNAADLKKLKALVLVVNTEAPSPASPSAMDELQRHRDSLQHHLQRLQTEIERIQTEVPFTMQSQLTNETWIDTRRAEIDTECAALENLRIQLEAHVNALAANPTNGQVTGLN